MEIPVYLELENDHSSTMFNNNNNDNKMAEEPLLIHPHGILRNVKGRGGVGDLEHVHIDGMNRNNPRMYEYDYAHQYEELPGGRKSTAKYPPDSGLDSNSQYQSSGGATDIVSEVDDTADIVKGSSDKRKRVNPLYDAMTQSVPSIYNKTKSSKDEKLRREVRCLKCALIILFVFCCTSVGVSIYAVLSYKDENGTLSARLDKLSDPDHHSPLSERLDQLTADYANLQTVIQSVKGSNSTLEIMTNLIQKVSELERNSSAQIGILNQHIANLEKNISQNSDTTADVYTELKIDVTNLTASVQHQLDTISKMEGPRGPQGVANFSKCSYTNITNNSPASTLHPSYTGWAPSILDLEDTIAIFAACSADNGSGYMIDTNAISETHVQYRCVCTGVTDDRESRRYCHLHLITCPRYS